MRRPSPAALLFLVCVLGIMLTAIFADAQKQPFTLDLPAAKIQEAQEYAAPNSTPKEYILAIIKNRVLKDLGDKRMSEAEVLSDEAREADKGAF